MLTRIAPKSLYGRTILIVVLPLFLMQVVITWAFFNRHWEEVTSTLAKQTASDLAFLTIEWSSRNDVEERAALMSLAAGELRIDMRHVPEGLIPQEDQRSIFHALNRTLDRELDWSLDYPYWYNTQGFDEAVEVRVQLDDGYIAYRFGRDRVVARNGHLFILWLIGATLLLGYIALIFLRNQVRSITRLAAAADAFGRGLEVKDFKPTGAREVRQAGHAFLAMRQRIRRFLEQRTEMLAGVSHDLRTPLTRIKLQLALDPDAPGADEIKSDVEEMEHLLEAYLTFARGNAEAVREEIDLAGLGDELARNAERMGQTLEVDVPEELGVIAHNANLRRALTNLIENAFKFSETVCLSAREVGSTIEIAVDDDGPGIAPEDREHAIKAFGRLDQARSANVPGSGLGLSIVRDVARAHGGRLVLEESPFGGLRATIVLPKASSD